MYQQHLFASPQYPYLLTPPASTQSSPAQDPSGLTTNSIRHETDTPFTYSSSSWTEDIEMGWDGDSTEATHYLALDTNILINYLPLVQALHKLLEPLEISPLTMLIPSVVLSELDGLKTSNARCPGRHTTVGENARAATSWMLSVNKARRESGRTNGGVLRGQRWAEKRDKERTKGDDRILDCCLYFRDPPLGPPVSVTLWTDDRNLALLAENEDIITIGSKRMSLVGIIIATGIELPEEAWRRVPALHAALTARLPDHGSAGQEETEMDLDEDLMERPDQSFEKYNHLTHQEPVTEYSNTRDSINVSDGWTYSTASPSNHTPTSSTIGIPSTSDHDQFRYSLNRTLQLIIAALPDTSIPDNLDPLSRLIAILDHFESSHIDNGTTLAMTDNRQKLIRAISAIRTIDSHFGKNTGRRKPRTGEVGDALELLKRMLEGLGLQGEFVDDLKRLALEIRRF